MFQYFDKVIRGTENEDNLVINQYLKKMIGNRFSLLNYYKEIPVSFDARLLSVENEMAEFEVHEYQAKVIDIERKTLIYANEKGDFKDDIYSEVFYVNIAKKRVILCKFGYAKIRSNMRRFVRVKLDRPMQAELIFEDSIIQAGVNNISLGGASMNVPSCENLIAGAAINLFLKLPDISSDDIVEVGMTATVISVSGDTAPFTCILEFHPEKHSQQQIAYFINLRQVEIIKELKELKS